MASILLIEQDETARLLVAEILVLAQHEVIEASTGKTGIQLARSMPPDLIISSINLPDIDGFGVLQILRKDIFTVNIPFIYLSSRNEITALRLAMNLGADDYLVKPVQSGDLLNSVDRQLNNNLLLKATLLLAKDNLNISTVIPINVLTSNISDQLDELIASCDTNNYKKNQVIYSEGSTPRFLYHIKSGKIKALKSHEDGKSLVIRLFGEGDFMGYLPILEDSYQVETTQAIEDCELTTIPRQLFEDLLYQSPMMMKKFMQLMAKNLMEMEQEVIGFAYNTLRKKVAVALMSYERKYHTGKTDKFCIDIGRNELANIAGTATESLIRTLTEFKNENLIELDKGIITIINGSRLINLLR